MDLGLADKVAFIAGSSRGIGLAIARGFASEGASVVISGRDAAVLENARASLASEMPRARIHAIAADLTDPEMIESAVSRAEAELGPIYAAIANLGKGQGSSGYRQTPDEWSASLTVNLLGGILFAGAALARQVARRHGSVTFISSIAGVEATAAPVSYSAAKAALQTAAKAYSRQVGSFGVRVNAVAPGNVLFPGGSWAAKLAERKEFFEDYVRREVPLQRFARVQEIADVVVFLASERASFVTGSVVVVDGGQTRGY
jgi:3-oxoacyl-[acyl-carrier protein] reductase